MKNETTNTAQAPLVAIASQKDPKLAYPHTVTELYAWCDEQPMLPNIKALLFLGRNSYAPCAFGFYRINATTGDFVVYRNDDSNNRSILYQGPSEACAVYQVCLLVVDSISEPKKHTQATHRNLFAKNFRKPRLF